MPQMMPMLWLMIFFLSLSMLIVLIFMMYFMKLLTWDNLNLSDNLTVKTWNWKW